MRDEVSGTRLEVRGQIAEVNPFADGNAAIERFYFCNLTFDL